MKQQDSSVSLGSAVDVGQNLNDVRRQMADTARRFNRNPDDIQLLAVSKTKPPEAVQAALAAGQLAFGENYLQDALSKIEVLGKTPQWHFIGPIQSNKTRAIAEHFAWVHSVERLKIAQRLSAQRPANAGALNVCLQVNISAESSKSGVSLTALPELAAQVAVLPGLALRGVMAVPAATTDIEAQRRSFKALRLAFKALQQQLPTAPLDTLSMGMSGDLEAAIAEGSTMVRVGTAIFGARAPKVDGSLPQNS